MFLSIGLGFLINRNYYKKELVKMLDEPGFMFLGGLMALLIGMLIIQYHNIWVWDWIVIITLIGWLALLKGIFIFIFPTVGRWFKPLFHETAINYMVILVLVIGLIFGYWGFLI